MPDVGIILLEDAETGGQQWVDTGSRAWRREFSDRVTRIEEDKQGGLRSVPGWTASE